MPRPLDDGRVTESRTITKTPVIVNVAAGGIERQQSGTVRFEVGLVYGAAKPAASCSAQYLLRCRFVPVGHFGRPIAMKIHPSLTLRRRLLMAPEAARASGKGGGGGADGASFAHKAIDDAACISTAEKIGERCVRRAGFAERCGAGRVSASSASISAVPIWMPAAPNWRGGVRGGGVADAAGGHHRHVHGGASRGSRLNVPAWVLKSRLRNMPRWPPASRPWAMMMSAPCSSSQRASATVVALDITTLPAAFTCSSS